MIRMTFVAMGVACALSASSAAWGQVASTQSGSSLEPYRINPGDEVEIFVWGEERLQRVVRVLPDGSFSFPLVGRVEAASRLPSELERVITQGLASQYSGAVPQVTVSVRNPSGMQFSVIGKVRSPGTFTPGRYVNALEALSIAGGGTEFADLNNVIIIRKGAGGLEPVRVRLNQLLKGSPSARDVAPEGIPQIRSGDTVVVP
jgi:polysaccharide biosynthesis/export protein